MRRNLLAAVAIVALCLVGGRVGPPLLALDGWAAVGGQPQPGAASATLITEPGRRYGLGEGWEVDADGLARVIVLIAEQASTARQPLTGLEPVVQVHRRFTHLIQGLALRLNPAGLPALQAHPNVEAVFPDARLEAFLDESVPLVGAPQVWALSDAAGLAVTGAGVRVAILDTGVDYTHPALGGCLGHGCRVAGGYDFVHDDLDPQDDHGHGTHVAGIVAADGQARGVAPGVELLAYKVLDEGGGGYASDIIAAMEQAAADGADVINLSLGGPGTAGDPVSLAAQAAVEAGIVVVAAAGNQGPRPNTVAAPALAPGVIAVGASDRRDAVADSSSRGSVPGTYALKPDLVAPGVAIRSTVPLTGPLSDPTGWGSDSGTSMAAPHVAGGVALLLQIHPDWTPAQVAAALMNTARDLEVDLFAQGAGRIELFSAATSRLLAVPGSLSLGLPLLDPTGFVTLTLTNLSTATLAVTPTLTLVQAIDGVGQPISPPRPVAYASVLPDSLRLAPGGSRPVTITLEIPPSSADGHYQGRICLHTQDTACQTAVPLTFSLLSRVTVRVLDERGAEIRGWGHMAALARMPGDFVVSSSRLVLPARFTVPAGDYYAQAFGRFGLYDHLLIPGLAPQVPYALVSPATIAPHSVQTLTLTLVDTRLYWLDAAAGDGSAQFINAWGAGFRYRGRGSSWRTRLGQSYVRVLSTDLPDDWPDRFALRLSDTPPDVAFHLALQAAGFSPRYRDFVARNGALWPADPAGGFGFPLVGSADQVALLAWERPSLGASTPPTFTVTAAGVDCVALRTDLPGLLEAPWLGWEAGAGGWLYPPSGAGSGLEPTAPGLTQTLAVSGSHQVVYWAGDVDDHHLFLYPFYEPDWSQTKAWEEDADVLFPEEMALQPALPAQPVLTLGAGPLYPALAFDNQPGLAQMRHPLLAGADAAPVAWGPGPPTYTLSLAGSPLASGTLAEYDWSPAPLRRWPDLSPGQYQLVITHTTGLSGLDSSSPLGPGIIRAGFTLTHAPDADRNPPRLLDLALPQRYDPTTALTVTWALSDASPVALAAAARRGQASWQPVVVEALEGGQYRAVVEPQGALTVALAYTATDAAGNWLAWQPGASAAAQAQAPVTLSFALEPLSVPWTRQPVTVRIVGSLRGPGDQPLAESPAWLRLYAGGQFVGHIRDLTGVPGNYQTGDIDFRWTFVPADLARDPGPLAVRLDFDLGLYAPQTATRTLTLAPPAYLYLPLVLRGTQP